MRIALVGDEGEAERAELAARLRSLGHEAEALSRLDGAARFDVVHADGLSLEARTAMHLQRRQGGAVVLTCTAPPRAWALRLYARLTGWPRWPHVLSAPSAAAAEALRAIAGRDVERVVPGIDPAEWAAPPRGPADPVVVASVLGFHRRERPLALVRTIHEMVGWIGDYRARFVLAGDGPERARVARELERRQLGAQVELAGELTRARLAELFARADLCLLPSENTFAALAARAAGLPLVAPRALAELVDHAGLLAGSRADLRDHAIRLIVEEPERLRLAHAAPLGLEPFSWRRVARRHLALYRLALARAHLRRSIA